MHAIVTCKNEEDQIKNEVARVTTKFLPLYAQMLKGREHRIPWSDLAEFRTYPKCICCSYYLQEYGLKTEGHRVDTTSYVDFSDAQGQITHSRIYACPCYLQE